MSAIADMKPENKLLDISSHGTRQSSTFAPAHVANAVSEPWGRKRLDSVAAVRQPALMRARSCLTDRSATCTTILNTHVGKVRPGTGVTTGKCVKILVVSPEATAVTVLMDEVEFAEVRR